MTDTYWRHVTNRKTEYITTSTHGKKKMTFALGDLLTCSTTFFTVVVDVLHDLLHRCFHLARREVVRLGRIHMRTERLSCDVEYIFWT